MTLSLAFWIIFLIWLILSCYQSRGLALGISICVILMFGLLGYAIFGSPLVKH